MDLAQLEIAVETTEVGKVSRELPDDPQDPVQWFFTRSVSLERTGQLALKTTADPSAKRVFRVPKARLSDVKATIELTESGMLAAINTSAVGRGDDFLLAVAKFAGVVGGIWTGNPFAGLTFATTAGQAHALAHHPAFAGVAPASLCPPAEQLELEGVAVEMQAFVSLDPAGCRAFLGWRTATASVESKRIQRDQLAAEIPGASGTDLTNLNKKLQSFRLEVAYAEAVQAERRETLSKLYDGFAAKRCLGRSVDTEAFRELFALDRLPPAEAFGWLEPKADLSRDAAARKLSEGGFPEMRALFDKTGVVATLDDAPAIPRGADGEPIPATAPGASEIAWRQAVPARVRIWTLVGGKLKAKRTGGDSDACAGDSGEDSDSQAVIQITFDGVIDLLHPASPVHTLPADAKAFADRSLTVAFDPRGRPRKIDTSGSSSAAGFAQAAAAAAQGFRDEYEKSLESRVSIEESRRELALDGLNDQIAALEAQKRELDARADLLGTSGGFDDLVARQKLESELKLVEAQVALRTAEATADHRVAIAELEKHIAELQKRLALLEAQQALENAGHSN